MDLLMWKGEQRLGTNELKNYRIRNSKPEEGQEEVKTQRELVKSSE